MLLRLVLDTSILIAALRSTTGAAGQLLREVLEGKFILLMDYRIASEYRDVALRPVHLAESHLTAEEIEEVIVALEDLALKSKSTGDIDLYRLTRPTTSFWTLPLTVALISSLLGISATLPLPHGRLGSPQSMRRLFCLQ